MEAALVDRVDRHVGLVEDLGIVEGPDLDEDGPRSPGARLRIWVPQAAQNSRVTGVSRSGRWKALGATGSTPGPAAGNVTPGIIAMPHRLTELAAVLTAPAHDERSAEIRENR
jgi:hypothetical protein